MPIPTRGFTTFEVSGETYHEIRGLLVEAGYQQSFHEWDDGEFIDMRGVALKQEAEAMHDPTDTEQWVAIYVVPGGEKYLGPFPTKEAGIAWCHEHDTKMCFGYKVRRMMKPETSVESGLT